MEQSLYFSQKDPLKLATLSGSDAEAYLKRIKLPSSLLAEKPSKDLLAKLQWASLTNVPFDTTSIHVKPEHWQEHERPITLGEGNGMQLGEINFRRIVEGNRGGFCFSVNSVFAMFLRSFGFTISECPGRVFRNMNKDPKIHGYSWTELAHQVNIVDWPGSETRYMVDVGFGGGGCSYPIELKDQATAPSDIAFEDFQLRYEDLPQGEESVARDKIKGFTLYRHVCDPAREVNFYTPSYHFYPTTMDPADAKALNYYQESHPSANFVTFFLVTMNLDGARKTLAYSDALKNDKGQAKFWIKSGILGEETDVAWIDFNTTAIGKVLEKEFGFNLNWRV